MLPRDLLQSMKDDLERKSPEDITDVAVKIQSNEILARATVTKFVEGRWLIFEVIARPIGVSRDIEIGA